MVSQIIMSLDDLLDTITSKNHFKKEALGIESCNEIVILSYVDRIIFAEHICRALRNFNPSLKAKLWESVQPFMACLRNILYAMRDDQLRYPGGGGSYRVGSHGQFCSDLRNHPGSLIIQLSLISYKVVYDSQ